MSKRNCKLRILLITPLWTGVKNFFLKGENKAYGMPAFFNILQQLAEDKDVAMIVVALFINTGNSKKEGKISIPPQYQKKMKILPFYYNNKFELLIKVIWSIPRLIQILLKHKINIIYGYGSIGCIAGILSLLTRVPNVRRVYGTFLFRELKNSKVKIFLKHPLEFMTFSLPAKAIIVTNDGTYGDRVYNKIGNKKAKFFFLLNGVENPQITSSLSDSDRVREVIKKSLNDNLLSYVARIEPWKRQHLFIEIIKLLREKDFKVKGLIIGHVTNERYYKSITNLIKKYHLENDIYIIPGLSHQETLCILKKSKLSFSLYEASNLGNVLLEILSLGVPIVARDYGNLNIFPDNILIKVDTDNPEKIAEIVANYLQNDHMLKEISQNALEFSKRELMTWKNRARKEIKILKESAC